MTNEILKTKFAPAARAHKEIVKQRFLVVNQNQTIVALLNALSQMVIILNEERQIIYANKSFLNLLNIEDQNILLGKRPGEAVSCLYSNKEEGGCGTSEFCRTCGAVNSILEAQGGQQSTKECRILTSETSAFDLRVTSTPFKLENYNFTIFTIIDIGDEKRRQTLERVFFHDVLNSAGGISGLSDLLPEIDDKSEVNDLSHIIKRSADNLIEEIQLQRQLSAAERGDLELKITTIQADKITKDIKELYSNHEITKDKRIKINESSDTIDFLSDKVLVRRIVGNMLKNAIEASTPGETVNLGCTNINGKTRFSVHNNSFMTIEVQNQLFQRSFSTKGTGRGIGTYSMKLLGEKYLSGKVWFESKPDKGTTFYLEL